MRRVGCRSCGKVKRERLAWLADNPFYTKRFAWRGAAVPGRDDQGYGPRAELDWETVKTLEKQYMREQLAARALRGPR